MVLSLNYRRPPYVSSSCNCLHSEKNDQVESIISNSSCPYGIPEALSFDEIINGGTCPPVTIREFMDFLRYIEFDAENLQFFLWYKDYCKRFAELPDTERKLAPEWAGEQALAAKANAEKKLPKKVGNAAAAVLKGTDFDLNAKLTVPEAAANPFNTPPRAPSATDRDNVAPFTDGFSEDGTTLRARTTDHSKKAEAVFEEAGALQPFTIQPFREEVSRIIAIYIADGARRSLNLSSQEKAVLLKALSITTHPSAFREVIASVEWSLRRQAHPNYIRWTICNGNKPRQTFARGLGVGGIVAGMVYAIVVTLSSVNRGWRALAFLSLFIGIATLFAAWKGMCVLLHGVHHRHLRPWELFGDEDEASSDYGLKKGSFDSLGSSNSYEDEPWVAQYEKRNVIRKIFDREVWIQEPALRQIQDTIFVQALIIAFIISAITTAIFLAIPRGKFF
ncbi:uncharacterized protein Z518_09250 [Rhinocladiella mackenziei CBS 650.93]|uniref:Rhinocladiella mackenziei CBS 650.93 unplaced genomic scaffold supercont1.7, whole genome shotgun sequence n=1 Tax=Rhinocladiella mackenziei CBS 650.93 TaxID=1442369 RepID=A0A0D2I6V0_9EURO|nr:uncharacterized protein Z518_09250 [Rhinocladiella mackenziei CBS 650.93]KIX01524.1 hypothetical protein Z518_09250 [Rhinocladiella mackenziei CBS 650.93]